MTDITCSACGAPNPSQSKYCNRCGAPLGSEDTHVCPTCDTPNPANLMYCDNCGTRLVEDSSSDEPGSEEDAEREPGSRSQPFSLPARPPGQTGNLDVSSELPDWLVTGDFAEDDFEGVSEEDELRWLRAAQEGTSWDDDEAPTLEELSSDHTPEDDLPTWLVDEESESNIFVSDKSTDELFMDSLPSDEDTTQEPETTESEPPIDDLESWLSDMEDGEPQQVADDSDAPELQPDEEEAAEEQLSAAMETSEDNFLQWLSEVEDVEAGDVDESHAAAPDPADVPAWLSDDMPTVDRGDDDSDKDDPQTIHTPEWVAEDAEASADFHAGSEEDEQPDRHDRIEEDIPEDDFLQWLDSLDEGAAEAGTEPDAEEEAEPTQERQSEFQETPEDQPSDEAPAESLNLEEEVIKFTAEDFALPDWLGDLSKSDQDEEQIPPSGDALSRAEELPAWLQDVAPPGGDVTLPYVSGSEAELSGDALDANQSAETEPESGADASLDDIDIPEGELPDWLSGVTSELGSAPSDLTILDDASETEEIVREDELARAESSRQEFDAGDGDELEDEHISSDDLPDWFSDVLADIETVDDVQTPAASESEMPNVPKQLAGSELPDWLDSPFHDEEEVAEPTPIEEIPEWLRAPLQEKLARAAEERGVSDAAPEGGEEWRDLLEAPPSTGERTGVDAGRESAVAWLESLRADPSRGDLADSESETDAGEPRNPIAGIPGAIDPTYGASHTANKRLATEEASGKEQEQQILLLRQMARGERVKAAEILPLATAVGALPLIVRLTLSAVLLVIVLLGLFASNIVSGIVPQATGEPTVAPLESLLSEASGSPVLVIFDYSPAMAGALQPVAADLLQRLQEQNSYTLIASQSAAGLALAADAAGDSDPEVTGELGLIPGGALGVRQIGHCMREEAQCETLFGQPVASEDSARLSSASSIVLITGDRDNLVAWVEQLETVGAAAIGAVVTPALEPVTAPYALSGQLDEVVVGTGAATLPESPDSRNQAAALILANWFAILVIVAGAVFYLISGLVRSVRG